MLWYNDKNIASGGGQKLSWVETLIMGIVSGLAEFLPVSASGHQYIFLHLFGEGRLDPLFALLLNLALSASVIVACKSGLRRILAERAIEKRGRKFQTYGGKRYEYRLVSTVTVPLVAGILLSSVLPIPMSLPLLAITFILNGVFLFVTGSMRQGNKDSRRMTMLDSIIMGGCGLFSCIGGFSPIGIVASAGIARGAARHYAVNWALLICLPVLLTRSLVSLFTLFSIGTSLSLLGFIFALLGAALAYLSGRAAIRFIRFISSYVGLTGFSYYCWGAALLAFILYLIT